MEVRIADEFTIDVRKKVYSKKVFAQIRKLVSETLLIVPTIGSCELPQSIRQEFGDKVRSLSVSPFLIIYEYDEKSETVDVYALLHEKQAF